MNPLIIALMLCYVIQTLATLLYVPHIIEVFRREPWFFAVLIPVVLAYSASIYWIFRGKVKLDKMSY